MRLYNTLTRRIEELPPPPGPIRMYFCGPTVYQRAHIGNARPFVLGMWLRTWLRHQGYDAILVHNITDINDRIYEAAPGASAELAESATEWYLEDTGDLGLGMPDLMPRATESVEQIIDFIHELIDSGHAYAVEGDVYFRVAGDPQYGRLSGQRPDQVEEQEPNPLKGDPRDFALWKASKPGEDTSWDSPWGRGRPGWHIECSAMAEAAFGPVFEIHGGGIDLVFPHHENELAQSSALGHEFARIWTHNGLLDVAGAKMSKSLGNDVSLRNVLDTWGREVVLVYFLTGHWRKPIDFTDETLAQARAQWQAFQGAYRVARSEPPPGEWQRLVRALDDDFNTPDALAVLHDWRGRGFWTLLGEGLELFGLALPPLPHSEDAERLRAERDAARAAQDWTRADELREEIRRLGFDVVDGPEGSRVVPL
jgi:cysteinyl-tRNA synthetase